jgi:hypothetical protein
LGGRGGYFIGLILGGGVTSSVHRIGQGGRFMGLILGRMGGYFIGLHQFTGLIMGGHFKGLILVGEVTP